MKHKISSLCIIATLLLGSTSANAAYYYYRTQPATYQVVTVSTCNTCNTCSSCQTSRCGTTKQCAYPVKHHYRHHVSHHPKYYYPSDHHTQRSHYSISSYYVYTTPFGDALWVPGCGTGCCTGRCGSSISAAEYDRAFYGPYYPAGTYPRDDSDFDFDTRTGDDVYSEY